MEKSKPDFDFKGKYIIDAEIHLKTALHIGGTDEGFDIGGIDNQVIKDKMTGVPYIPGSSLKGKMRSLLEWVEKVDSDNNTCITVQLNVQKIEYENLLKELQSTKDKSKQEKIQKKLEDYQYKALPCKCAKCRICKVFGAAAEGHKGVNLPGPTRLTVRDAMPKEGQVEKWETIMGETIYTEAKTENTIDRLTSAANPRTMERVPAESVFMAQFIYDVYHKDDIGRLKLLFEGMQILEDSALGGGGSRGSGRVKFKEINITAKDKTAYIGGDTPALIVNQNGEKTVETILANFDTIFPSIGD